METRLDHELERQVFHDANRPDRLYSGHPLTCSADALFLDVMPDLADDRMQHFSDVALSRIIAKRLPAWKRACAASDANAIVLHESAFGRSHSELLLLACAIKYAALNNKTIHIDCGGTDCTDASGSSKGKSIRIFHERERRTTGETSRRGKRSAK